MFSSRRTDCLSVAYLLLCACTAIAQNLTVPTTWLNPTSNMTREDRMALASGAANALVSQASPAGTSAQLPLLQDVTGVYAALANQDYYSGNTSWSGLVPSGVQGLFQKNGLYSGTPAYNSDGIYWGLAYFYAYRAYKQQALLDLAISAYNATYASFITPEAAASGKGAGRNVTFAPAKNCTTKTIAGGVFWTKDQKNVTNINAETVAPFMALSAYLFEQTNDTLYRTTGQLSLDFMLNLMWNGTTLLDSIDPKACTITEASLTYDQAWFVEGLAVMANVTRNNTLTKILDVVVPSVVSFPKWTLQSGVIGEAPARDSLQAPLKGIFIRSLTEVRNRNPGTPLAQYLSAFITVQFNSLINSALAPNTNFYTTSWLGPSNSTFSGVGNLAALDVLNAALTLDAPSSSNSSSTSSSSSSTVGPTSSATSSALTSTDSTAPTSMPTLNSTSSGSSNTNGATGKMLPTIASMGMAMGSLSVLMFVGAIF